MITFKLNAKNFTDAESMAAAYLAAYFDNSEIKYPITWILGNVTMKNLVTISQKPLKY